MCGSTVCGVRVCVVHVCTDDGVWLCGGRGGQGGGMKQMTASAMGRYAHEHDGHVHGHHGGDDRQPGTPWLQEIPHRKLSRQQQRRHAAVRAH